uniref:Uncharacterized protein n=1 Tax=Oryza barthii TaxID=65489 RepID=A0A0D3GJA5_9ORYZ
MASEVVRRRRRIADYLNDGEELGIEGSPAVTPRSPALAAARSLLPRFRWARAASRIGRKGKAEKEGVVVVEEEIAVEKNGEPVAAAAAATVASTSVFDNESHTRTPDLGVGLSLVFLLAKTSDEFNKMAKVRAEMETLLREIKEQVRQSSSGGVGDDDASKPRCNLESAASSCLTDTNENERASARMMEDQATSSSNHMEEEEVSCEKSAEEYESCFPRMDVLEEEFHAELDLLQVNYGSDVQLFLPEEHDAEQPDEITECREEFNDDVGREDEVVEDEDYDDEAEYNGVNAVELERRLHELLHQRNQERIEELELALKRAEKKLVEKEMEVSMWKDTAKLALRQDSSTMLW